MEVNWFGIVGSIVTVAGAFISTFIAMGKLWRQAEETSVTVAMLTGKLEILKTELGEHKVYSAREYVTNGELRDAVRAVTDSIDRLGRDLKDYVSALTKRGE